jgi:hypothetical protein
MTAAIALAAPELPAPSTERAIAAYLEAIERSLAGALRTAVDTLAEPRVTDPDRALHRLGCLVESLAGFALGSIAGELITGLRRWFGDDVAAAVAARVRTSWPTAARAPVASGETRYLADAQAQARPLVDELASRLHVRFCRASIDLRALVATIEDVVAERAPDRPRSLAIMLDQLARDEARASRLAAELAFGWRVFVAAVTGKPFPATTDLCARSQALWLAWQHQLGGRPAVTRDEPQRAGYIMLVR